MNDDFRVHFEAEAAAAGITYTALFKMIVTQRLKGPLVESMLAAQLDSAPQSVRLALHRLEAEKLVVRGDNGGFVVRQVSGLEFVESASVRATLESEAAALAAGHIPDEKIDFVRRGMETHWNAMTGQEAIWRLDESLHDLVAEHCRNPVMGGLMASLRVAIKLHDLQFMERRRSDKRLEASLVEHLEILRALELGHGDKARKAMLAHVKSTGDLKIRT